MLRRLVDVDADGVTVCVDVDYDTVADLTSVDAGALGEIDVQAVRVWEVFDPHGLNLRSGQALWMVLRSASVTTRMHISRVMQGRSASTLVSKCAVKEKSMSSSVVPRSRAVCG